MSARRTSETVHNAGGQVVTGPTSLGGDLQVSSDTILPALGLTGPASFAGILNVASKVIIKEIQANSTFAGVTTILSGLASAVISMSLVKSDSLIMLQPITANASNLAQNYSINPASTVDGTSFMVISEGITVLDVPVNYQVIQVI